MIKRVYAVLMTYDITDDEKRYAEQALTNFDGAAKLLEAASENLNLIKTPFKDNEPSTPEEILETRAALRRFRDSCVQKFNAFKTKAFSCVNSMKEFGSDTMTAKLMKSFISSVELLETDVNEFLQVFDDLKAKDFQTKIVSSCEDIQLKCEDIADIINQRIKNHIQENILSKNWVDTVSNELQTNVEKYVPILTEINREEKEKLNQTINNK